MAEKTKLWYLQNFNLFESIPMSAMKMLEKNTGMLAKNKKQILYFPDEISDTIYFLKEGKIKISRLSEDGKTTVLQLLGPGEIFGESAILGSERHDNIAEVLEDSIVCTVNKDIFTDMMMKNPKLNLKITKYIGWQLRKVETKVEDLVFKDAHDRVKSFLKNYIQKFGSKMMDGWFVRPLPSQQDIADLTAVSRQTASQILNELKEEKLIDFSRRYLRIPDINAL